MSSSAEKIENITFLFRKIMDEIGVAWDDSTAKTPQRVAEMYVNELFKGLIDENFPAITTVENIVRYDHMVIIKDIKVHSVCEHHFVPFLGLCHIAYLPDNRIMGLSKFNRVVDHYSRRPQIQERLTHNIYGKLSEILQTPNVAVYMDCEHQCVKLRGIGDQGSHTITNKLGGRFMEPDMRAEFMSICRQ